MLDVMMVGPLTAEQLAAALSDLRSWQYDAQRKTLLRIITLRTFSEAFGLMTRIALEAEKANHHPDWSNVYNRLEIRLTTHDAGDVTDRDTRFAKVIDQLFCEERR